MGYDAVLFDMDGLMVDSERIVMKAWLETCERYGQPIDESVFKETVGTNGQSIRRFYLNRFGEDFPIDEAFAACDALYLQRLDAAENFAKPGLRALVDYLATNGVVCGVCSSSSREKIRHKLSKVGVFDDMREAVGGDEVENGKPHPEPYLKLADKLRVPIARCLALEDSYNGIRSAASAGADVVMIPDLLEPTDEIRALCVEVVESLEQVIDVLER